MQLQITHVNRDKNMEYASYSYPLEPNKLKGLFRRLSREFGRCTSKVYVGEGILIGWVFEKKPTKGYFVQETWVTISEANNANT